VIILAAGLGTRMKSKVAKVLHRAGGLCLAEHVVRASLAVAPAGRISVVVGHQAERVRGELEHYGVRFAAQEEQKGTGHAVLAGAATGAHGDGMVLVLVGDCPLLGPETLAGLLERHRSSGAAATVITTLLDDPYGYGRIVRDEAGAVAAIVEEKAASAEQKQIREINSGIFCFEAGPLWEHLGRVRPNAASGEIYLTDVVEHLRAAGLATVPYLLADSNQVLGINTRVELAQVDRVFRERKARELMLGGVTIEKPETVTIDTDVEAGQDTVLGPFVQLRGRTRVGADCQVGACAILENTTLADGVTVYPFSVVVDSRLEAGSSAGPYARLRMNSVVEPGAQIGNFVELKNTRLGAGAKAMHLAYLGDSGIGAKVNIGAGTITCNYDGVKKHRTTIGDGAFVGSNSTLVAPVEIGHDSYVAAGSVITKPVAPDSLAIGRAHQVAKEEWAKRRREKNAGKQG
jgi:bifunctional UDP-N-acetylglucosamine pyrophosphorylase/glucosamine-1-phosphate N-acetyltransferase